MLVFIVSSKRFEYQSASRKAISLNVIFSCSQKNQLSISEDEYIKCNFESFGRNVRKKEFQARKLGLNKNTQCLAKWFWLSATPGKGI
jgi:hypothetical protein